MRVLRALAGALLWILATVLGLVAVILCATLILLPLGIPLLMLARRLFGLAVRLFLPRGALHPVKASGEATKSALKGALEGLGEQASNARPKDAGHAARKQLKKGKKRLKKVANA
jgi:hypothetical protein